MANGYELGICSIMLDRAPARSTPIELVNAIRPAHARLTVAAGAGAVWVIAPVLPSYR